MRNGGKRKEADRHTPGEAGDRKGETIKIRDETGRVVRGMCRAPDARRIFYKCTVCPYYFPALKGYCNEEETKTCRECRRQ